MRNHKAAEAAVFYASRVLEALSRNALTSIGLMPSVNLFHNLETLGRYDLIKRAPRHFADALRRLSNRARHVLAPTVEADAHAAGAFLEVVLR